MEVDNDTATMEVWNRETVPTVMKIVCSRLPHRDLISLLLVSPWVHRNLMAHPSLWLVLDFHESIVLWQLSLSETRKKEIIVHLLETSVTGKKLPQFHSKYQNVKHIKLEFALDIEDKHLEIFRNTCRNSIGNLAVLNLNCCQKMSDAGIDVVTYNGQKLKDFSIYWNVRSWN